jgi:hypothetical protein
MKKVNILIISMVILAILLLIVGCNPNNGNDCKNGFTNDGNVCKTEKTAFECMGNIKASKGYYICNNLINSPNSHPFNMALLNQLAEQNATIKIIGYSWKEYVPCINNPASAEMATACNVESSIVGVDSYEILNQNNELKISISSDKQNYTIGEKIHINLSIENIGTGKITLFNLFDVEPWLLTYFKIVNPNGNVLEYNGEMIDKAILKKDYIDLQPQQKMFFSTELTGCYSEICVYNFSSIGEYQISFKYALSGRGSYEEQDEKGFLTGNKAYIDTWQGEIESNKIIITIKAN